MKIGIIGAMEEEVSKLKEQMSEVTILNQAGMTFLSGTLSGKETVVVRSGIGKVNAAVCAQILCDQFGVNGIINTGVAGSLRNEINIGDIVLSTDALNHDMDATGFGYQYGEIPRMDCSIFKADEKLLSLAYKICGEVNQEIQVFRGRVLSGDQFVSDPDRKKWLIREFDGYCVEMEGAAIAQAATLNKIPFLIIRAISDKADDSAHMDYSEFEQQAIKHTVNLVLELIKQA